MSGRYERLLTMVADRPEGTKVNIAELVRAFTPTQGEIIKGIQLLIDDLQLDPSTLRRFETTTPQPLITPESTDAPSPEARDDGDGDARKVAPSPTPGDLLAEISAFCERFDMRPTTFSKLAVNDFSLVIRLKAAKAVTQRTADKVRAFIASYQLNTQGASGTAKEAPSASSSGDATRIEDRAPSDEPAARSCPPPEAHLPTPQEFAAEITAFLKRTGTSKNSFGLKVIGSPSWAHNLAGRKRLKPEEVERARSLMAAARVDIKVNARRDPTQPPETPMMDYAERERMLAARAVQATKRRIRARAQKALDAGIPPAKASKKADVRGAMKELTENAEALARLSDPIEQAKSVLRRRFTPVCSAEFADPPGKKGQYLVGRRIVSEAVLLEMARRAAA